MIEDDVVNQFIRLKDIDFDKWAEDYQTASPIFAWATYLISVHLMTFLQITFFCLEVFLFFFLIPGGIGDKYYYRSMVLDPVVPSGLTRNAFMAFLFILLFLKVAYNLLYQGWLQLNGGTVGRVMSNRYVRRLICQRSFTKWRYIKYLNSQLKDKEQIMGMIVYAQDEWKRFLTIKAAIFAVACIQLYLLLTQGSPAFVIPQIQTLFVAYWSLRISFYVFEGINKFAALVSYLVYFINDEDLKTGVTIKDYYEMRAGSAAVELHNLKASDLSHSRRQSYYKNSSPIPSRNNSPSPSNRNSKQPSYQSYQSPRYPSYKPSMMQPKEEKLPSSFLKPKNDEDITLERPAQPPLNLRNESRAPPLQIRTEPRAPPPTPVHSEISPQEQQLPSAYQESEGLDEEDEVPPWMRYTLMTNLTRASNPYGI